jgi:hypothetical protein
MSLMRVVDDVVMTESGPVPLAEYIAASMDAEQHMMDMDVEIQHRHRAFASLLEEMSHEQ